MSGKLITLAVRAGKEALQDKRTRTGIAVVLCAIFMPLILAVTALLCMADGAAEHNRTTVRAAFDTSIEIPATSDAEYRQHIEQMRACFAALQAAADTLETPADAPALDMLRVEAIFYGLYYGRENLTLTEDGALAFVECFVTHEERDRETDEDGEATQPETYQAAIPITDLQTIFQNVAQYTDENISLEQQSACMEIYYLVCYGNASRAASTDDLVEILVDPDTEYTGGTAGSPFADDWRSHVTSEFVDRINPLTGEAEHHRGIDLAAPEGTPIYAVASGTVVLARYNHPSYGNYLVIDHGGGTTTLYAHCSALLVATGQTVSAGDIVARVGATGDATGNHLHLEVKVGGQLVNPRTFLQ